MRSSYRSCQSDKNEGMVSSEKKNSFLPKMDQKGSEERA